MLLLSKTARSLDSHQTEGVLNRMSEERLPLTAGPRGPLLMQDVSLLEPMQPLNRERIPFRDWPVGRRSRRRRYHSGGWHSDVRRTCP